eukprot:COSAG01_NODE_193_length_22433_cov_91.669114_15_plen_59_part_00
MDHFQIPSVTIKTGLAAEATQSKGRKGWLVDCLTGIRSEPPQLAVEMRLKPRFCLEIQ